MGAAPSGQQVTMEGIAIYRFADGKIVEKWGQQDRLSIMQQLGIFPTPQ